MQSYIYSYGMGEHYFYIFDGIARVLKPENTASIIEFTSLFGLIYIVAKNLYEGKGASNIMVQFKWALKYTLITGVVMLPKGSIIIKDVVSHIERKVDNLPVGLSLASGLLGGLGHALTVTLEKNFTPVDYLPYHQYGLVFGSQMVAETKNLKIEDPTFWENMYNFIDKCVIYDAMIGSKYTVKDLKYSTDIWKLLSENASSFFSFDYRNASSNAHRGPREIVSCRVGAQRLSQKWNDAYNASLSTLTQGLMGVSKKQSNSGRVTSSSNDALKGILVGNIQSSLNFLGGDITAQDYLKQHLMINTVQNKFSSLRDARASSSYLSSLMAPGDIARQSLPVLKGVIEAIVYVSFIFVFYMLMLPGGWSIFLRYIAVLYWLQLWAPLYAVLNMMMSLFAYKATSGEFSSGLNIANLNSVSNTHQWIAAFSGYLSASIPFIAKAIVDSSSHGLVQLAGSITGGMQSSSAQVANEAISGNVTLDNTSVGNLQYANSNLLKSDYGASFRGSSSEWQMQNGAIERVQANGQFMTMSGQGLTASTGHTRINTNEMLGANWTKSLGENASQIEALSHDTTQLEQNTLNRSSSMLAQYAERASEGETKDLSTTSQYAQSTAKTVEFIKNLQENHNFSHQQAAEMAILASANLNGSVGVGKNIGGINPISVSGSANATVGLDGRISNNNVNQQMVTQALDLAKRYNYNESYENVVRGMTSEQFSNSKHIDKTLSDDFNKGYHEMTSKQKALQNRIEAGKQYSEALSQLRSGGISYDHDGYHDMQQWLMDKKGMSQYQAGHVIDSGGREFKQYFNEYANEAAGTSKLISEAQKIQNNLDMEKIQKGRQEMNAVQINKDPSQSVREYAAEKGMNPNVNHLDSTEMDNKIQELNQKANNKFMDTKNKTQQIELEKQNEVDRLENKRLINKLPKPLQWIAPGRPKMRNKDFDE